MSLEKDLLNIDLGALHTLTLVHRLRSFSKAAEELDVKQSTISYTIDRLRRALKDPLFVRQGGGIAATERCTEAVDFAARVLAEAENLATTTEFDPSQATGTITITTGFYVQAVIMPGVIQRIRREAKGLNFRIIPPASPEIALFERNSDLVMLPRAVEANGVYRQHLYEESDVVLMDPNNPLSETGIDLEAYANAEHVGFELGFAGAFRQAWQSELAAMGYAPKTVVMTSDGSTLTNYLMGTDLIASVSSRFGRKVAGDLAVLDSPMDVRVNFYMYWAAAADRSPLNAWLRSVVNDVVAEISAPGTV